MSAENAAAAASTSAGFKTGDAIPASHDDTLASTDSITTIPTPPHTGDFEEGHRVNLAHHHLDDEGETSSSRSRSRSRARDLVGRISRSISRDPFFKRDSGLTQEEEIRQSALAEVQAAQAATEAGDIDRAMRASRSESRSRSRTREFIKSVSRSVSRDLFFKRDTGLTQEEEIRQSALSQTKHALDAHKAGVEDHQRRSTSRGASREASPLASPVGSRSASRARSHLGGDVAEPGAQGATFGTSA
ncbi:hypothetical protein RQP46_005586 [Phenoliferia psychrophenolica]